jgi:hypothetical protein
MKMRFLVEGRAPSRPRPRQSGALQPFSSAEVTLNKIILHFMKLQFCVEPRAGDPRHLSRPIKHAARMESRLPAFSLAVSRQGAVVGQYLAISSHEHQGSTTRVQRNGEFLPTQSILPSDLMFGR